MYLLQIHKAGDMPLTTTKISSTLIKTMPLAEKISPALQQLFWTGENPCSPQPNQRKSLQCNRNTVPSVSPSTEYTTFYKF